MKALWYWKVMFKAPNGEYWEAWSDAGFVRRQEAIDDINEAIQSGLLANAGVPVGSVLVSAEAILENKKVT